MKCKECTHFQVGPKVYPDLCINLGVKPTASACDYFFPDVTQLRNVGKEVVFTLKEVMEELNASQLRIFAMFMARNEWFKKVELKLFQQVYFSLGQNYLCNYVRGYVIGTSKNGQQVFLNSNLENLNKKKQATATLMRNSILTEEEFEKRKAELVKEGRIMEPPRSGIKRTPFQMLTMTKKEHKEYEKLLSVKPDDYQPPTLDSAPESWLDKRSVSKVIDPLQLKKGKKKVKGKEKRSTKITIKRG